MQDKKMIPEKYSALIMAAGTSGRMGQPKYSLTLPGGKTFLEHIVGQYLAFGCHQLVIVMNVDGLEDYEKKYRNIFPGNVSTAINEHPEWERFYSVQCGLKEAPENQAIFIHNVDNPFINSNILKQLLRGMQSGYYCKPVIDGKGGHPVLISPEIAKAIKHEPDHHSNIKDFLLKFRCHTIAVEDKGILLNINTPEEYEAFINSLPSSAMPQ